jgi:hypothetical protein
LIVVADRLLAYDNLVRGRYWSYDSVFVKARREASQIVRLIEHVAAKAKARSTGKIVYWDQIAEMEQFNQFSQRMRTEFLGVEALATAVDRFAKGRVERFGLGSSPERERDFEREYLLSEVCMSVYCTEVLGFSDEVWERPSKPELPDPLGLLYHDHADVVVRVTGRPARRRLQFLFDDAAEDKHRVDMAPQSGPLL